MDESALLTPDEVAQQLRVNPETVRRWLRSGQLRGVRLGGRRAGWRIARVELARFLAERGGERPTGRDR